MKRFRSTNTTIVQQWIDDEGAKIDKAFGKQPSPPSPSAETQPNSRQAECRLYLESEESRQLRTALIQYQQLEIDPRLDLDVDNCTWEDVFSCMAGARADYDQKAKNWRGVAHRLLRKAGDHADDVDPWLKLIPPEYGMGIIGAGISIMFRLARTASESREKILNAFEEIPIIVAAATAKSRAFPGNQMLQSHIEKLNLSIIVSVSKLVGCLLPEKHARKVQYFWFRSKLGDSTLDDVLKSLTQEAGELKRLVQDFVDEAIGEIQRTTRDIKDDTASLKQDTSKIKNDTAELKTATSNIQGNMSALVSEASALAGQIRRLVDSDRSKRLEIYWQKTEESNMSRGSLVLMLNEVMDALQRKEQEKESLRIEVQRIRSLSPVPGLMTADQLLFAIGASTLIQQSTEDIEKVLRFRSSIHPIAEGEATSLLRTDRFLDWIQPGRSDALLIDGAGGAIEFVDHVERVSAKSVLCASLLATLGRSQPKTIQLFFFCGLHSSEKDPLSDGPRGLMRSLLCELVKETHRRDWLHLDFINDRRYRDGLQNQSLGFMCDAFYRILQRLQMQDALDLSVYCVVDGIGQYEQQRWYDDLVIVINMFLRILNDTQLKPVFKLLLTGPQRVRYVHDLLGLPANRRLRANPVIASGGPASFGLLSGAEQILQGRRQQMVAERRGRSQYFDDVEFTADDYE